MYNHLLYMVECFVLAWLSFIVIIHDTSIRRYVYIDVDVRAVLCMAGM